MSVSNAHFSQVPHILEHEVEGDFEGEAEVSQRSALLSEQDNTISRRNEPSRKHHGKSKEKESRLERKKERDLQRLLLYEERESKHLRTILKETVNRLESEMDRASDAESRLRELTSKASALEISRQTALTDVARANEELRLYKVQYTNIQRELERAQNEYNKMAAMRNAAEETASKAKQETRQLRTERMVEQARAEARVAGIEEGRAEGYQKGVQDGFEDGKDEGREEERANVLRIMERALADQGGSAALNASYEYFRNAPTSRIKDRPNRGANQSRSTMRSGNEAPDAAPIVNNMPIPTLVTPEILPQVGREVRPTSAPRSIRNAPSTPTFHGEHIIDGYIPMSDDGRIGLPPPHEINPNPAFSPSSIPTVLPSAQRPVSPSSASTRVSNFNIVHDVADMAAQEPGTLSARRSIPYRNAASPGLSVIPEDSNIDPSSPDMARNSRDIEAVMPNNRQWSAVSGDWGDQPDDRSVLRNGLRYSDPAVAEEHMSMRDETRSISNRTGPPRQRPVAITPSPLAARVEDFPEDQESFSNRDIGGNRGTVASPFIGSDRRSTIGSPISGHRLAHSELSMGGSPRSRGHARSSTTGDVLPEISILPPSRRSSFTSATPNENHVHSHATSQKGPNQFPVNPSVSRPHDPLSTRSPVLHVDNTGFRSPHMPSAEQRFSQTIGPSVQESRFDTEPAYTTRARSPFSAREAGRNSRSATPTAPDMGLASSFIVPENIVLPPSRVQSPGPSYGSERDMNRHSRVVAPTPRRPSAPSISSSASPQILMPGNLSRRSSVADSASTTHEDSESYSSSRRIRGSSTPNAALDRRRSTGMSSTKRSVQQPTYETAPLPTGLSYPTSPLIGVSNSETPSMPRSILRNPRTPGGAPLLLHSNGYMAAATPRNTQLGLSPANVPIPMTPAQPVETLEQQPRYEAAAIPSDVVYPGFNSGVASAHNMQAFSEPGTGMRSASPLNPHFMFRDLAVPVPSSPQPPLMSSQHDRNIPVDNGPVYPMSTRMAAMSLTPGMGAGYPSDLWQGIPLPPSIAPSVQSLNWHPSQHQMGVDDGVAGGRTPTLPVVNGPLGRPLGI